MRTLKIITSALALVFLSFGARAQETAQDTTKTIDPSNAGNLYTQINTSFEYKRATENNNIYGLRVNWQYAFNPNNLILFEVPVLYNDFTRKFGISDFRLRYYTAVMRNMTKTFTFLIPFADISIPTGSYTRGLGTGRWSFGVGMIVGVRLSRTFSLFPGVSYVYVTKDRVEIPMDDHSNGISIQTNASLRLSKRVYMFINPILTFSYTMGSWHTNWRGDMNLNYMVTRKFKIGTGWSPDFTNKMHTVRAGTTFYF